MYVMLVFNDLIGSRVFKRQHCSAKSDISVVRAHKYALKKNMKRCIEFSILFNNNRSGGKQQCEVIAQSHHHFHGEFLSAIQSTAD